MSTQKIALPMETPARLHMRMLPLSLMVYVWGQGQRAARRMRIVEQGSARERQRVATLAPYLLTRRSWVRHRCLRTMRLVRADDEREAVTVMVAVLRQRDFALVWLAALISRLGDFVLIAALPYFVYATAGSTLAAGLVLTAETVPALLGSAVGGVLADRWRRQPVLVASDVLRALLLLPLLAVQTPATLWIVYAIALCTAVVANVVTPFARAAVPHLVPHDALPAANGALSAANWIAVLVGSPIGGLTLQRGGLGGVVLVDACTFAASALLLSRVRVRLEKRADPVRPVTGLRPAVRSVWAEWIAGLRYSRSVPWLTVFFAVSVLAALGNAVILVLLAPFVRRVLDAPAGVYAGLLLAQGAGGLAGSLGVGRVTTRVAPPLLLGVSLLCLGLLEVAIAVAASLPITLVATALGGSTILFLVVSQNTIVQAGIPDAYRGRVFGVQSMLGALMALLGSLLAGVLGDRIGLRGAFVVGGLLFMAAGITGITVLTAAVRRRGAAPAPE